MSPLHDVLAVLDNGTYLVSIDGALRTQCVDPASAADVARRWLALMDGVPERDVAMQLTIRAD